MTTKTCPEHAGVMILEDSGGRDYCPSCLNADIPPADVYPVLVKLTNAIRAFISFPWNKGGAEVVRSELDRALDEAEEFLELNG